MSTYHPVIDISRWQGPAVDFQLMRSRGVEAVICRAGNGHTADPTFHTNVARARAAGLPVGSYWFVNPKRGDARKQGQMHANMHNAAQCEIPPMLDVEDYENEPGNLPPIYGAAFADFIRAELDALEANVDDRPFFYSNAAYWNPRVGSRAFGDYDIIVARYPWYSPAACAANVPPVDAQMWDEWVLARTTKRPQVPVGWDGWDGWQFSAGFNGRGAVYGCASSDLDLNIISHAMWQTWFPPAKPQPEVLPKPTPIEVLYPPTKEADMADIFRSNSEPRVAPDGTGPHNPGVVQFRVMEDGRKRWVTWPEAVLRGGVAGAPATNAELDAVADWAPPVAGGSSGILSGKITLAGDFRADPV